MAKLSSVQRTIMIRLRGRLGSIILSDPGRQEAAQGLAAMGLCNVVRGLGSESDLVFVTGRPALAQRFDELMA